MVTALLLSTVPGHHIGPACIRTNENFIINFLFLNAWKLLKIMLKYPYFCLTLSIIQYSQNGNFLLEGTFSLEKWKSKGPGIEFSHFFLQSSLCYAIYNICIAVWNFALFCSAKQILRSTLLSILQCKILCLHRVMCRMVGCICVTNTDIDDLSSFLLKTTISRKL